MKIVAPNYYKDFKCIADKCQHSCCIGWEIDIDQDTYEQYKNINTEFGNKLNDNIEYNGEIASFKLGENERCPFLNSNNLCEIILNLGENSLCQICNDHPRFRNYFSDRVEIGLGLCCEEATRIILKQNEPFKLVKFSEDNEIHNIYEDETEFFELRNIIFDVIKNTNDFKLATNKILNIFNITFPEKTLSDWADIYLKLERLDDKWGNLLNKLKSSELQEFKVPCQYKNALKNLFTYYIYRHLSESIYDEKFYGRLLFAVLSCYMIGTLCQIGFDIEEVARMYSSEIEYSDKNLDTIIELLQKENLEA